jgi:hypothetical protein
MTNSAHALRIVWASIAVVSAVVLLGSLYKWRHAQPVDTAAVCVALSGLTMALANAAHFPWTWAKVVLALLSLTLAMAGALSYFT